MRTLYLRPAVLAVGLFLCSAVALPVAAQSFVLAEPVLVADGRRVEVQGAPLRQDRFGMLVLAVPGVGTYTVADAPFEGARRAGEFDGAGLFFAADGVSVRLRGREPMLGATRRDAWVRTSPASGARGAARVALASRNGITPSEPEPVAHMSGPATGNRQPADQPLRTEVLRLRSEVARLAAEREEAGRQRDGIRLTLQADLDRVTAERDALRAERDRAVVERQRLAQSMERTRQEVERARDQGRTTAAEIYTQDLDDLRAEVIARDNAITLLTSERDDRGRQIASLRTEIDRLTTALAQAQSERDQARAEAAALRTAPEASGAEIERLGRETDRLNGLLVETRAERDRLAELTLVQPDALASGEAQIDALTAELAAVRSELAQMTTQLRESEEARLSLQVDADRLRTERDRLASGADAAGPALLASQAETDRLRIERDRLTREMATLRADLERLRQRPPTPAIPSAPAPTPEPTPAPIQMAPPSQGESAMVMLPGFDIGRLDNPDDVRERIDAVRYPRAAAESNVTGDVLVLFQTDLEGNVIRTAVPRPIGGGLDSLAEDLVRSMRFRPPTVDGQATGLRSQVVVRFSR